MQGSRIPASRVCFNAIKWQNHSRDPAFRAPPAMAAGSQIMIDRRRFISLTARAAGVLGVAGGSDAVAAMQEQRDTNGGPERSPQPGSIGDRAYNRTYEGVHAEHIAFPMGGIGAGMMCLEGSGALSHVSLWHRPDLKREPGIFAAVSLKTPASIGTSAYS